MKRNCMLNTYKHHLRGSDGTEALLMHNSHTRHVYHARDHASVRLPGVLHKNVGHRSLDIGRFKKIIPSDISAFEQGHCHVCW